MLTRSDTHTAPWNRFWFGSVAKLFKPSHNDGPVVSASWRGDALRFTSTQGHLALTHLIGRSGEQDVGAVLPLPVLLLGSGGAWVDQALWARLTWRDDGGRERSAPLVGSPITGLFHRLEATHWKPTTAPEPEES